jgi:hypothetical protein
LSPKSSSSAGRYRRSHSLSSTLVPFGHCNGLDGSRFRHRDWFRVSGGRGCRRRRSKRPSLCP